MLITSLGRYSKYCCLNPSPWSWLLPSLGLGFRFKTSSEYFTSYTLTVRRSLYNYYQYHCSSVLMTSWLGQPILGTLSYHRSAALTPRILCHWFLEWAPIVSSKCHICCSFCVILNVALINVCATIVCIFSLYEIRSSTPYLELWPLCHLMF